MYNLDDGIKWKRIIMMTAVTRIGNEEHARIITFRTLFISYCTQILLNMPPQIDKIKSVDEDENIVQSVPVDQNENIFNVRKYLLSLLFLQWVNSIDTFYFEKNLYLTMQLVFAIILGFGIYSVSTGNATNISSGIESLLPIIVLIIYYTFGLLVTYKQHRVGLLIVSDSNFYTFLFFFV